MAKIKLQQFYVMKFMSDQLDSKSYDMNLNLYQARKMGNVVSLADNQVLRTIRMMQYMRHPSLPQYSEDYLEFLQHRLKRIKKKKSSPQLKREKFQIIEQIDEILFIPQYVLVTFVDKNHYKKIIKNDGFYINGHKYKRLLCGAGMARNNTTAFIREDFEDELKELLYNGCDREIKITPNKLNAYFALSSSATYPIDYPDRTDLTPRFLLVDDCEVDAVKKVCWVNDVEVSKDDPLYGIKNISKTENKEVNVTLNYFDGGGLIDVSEAKRWADRLGLDYIPSVFVVRGPFVKGCLFTMDVHKYANEIAKCNIVTDLYGNDQNVDDIDIILTKSMFKLWNAYKSMSQYMDCCRKYHNYFGIARYSPKNDDDSITTNYQFLQALNMDENDVLDICSDTENWLKDISTLNPIKAVLFSDGTVTGYDNPVDYFDMKRDAAATDYICRALLVNPNMIKDDYIHNSLASSINKKIKQAKIGKLIVHGNFSTMIPDPYALLQWTFAKGDKSKVTGLLKNHEHYSGYWNKQGAIEVIACRSPLTWRSEVNKLNLQNNKDVCEWYKYLNSGIVYNVFGDDCMLHADSDYDGDICFTTNNKTFLKCKFTEEDFNLPVTYEKQTVPKIVVTDDMLAPADIASFDTKIGQITNYSTSMYDMVYRFKDDYSEYGRRCYNELIERLKLTRKAQGDEID